MQSVLGKTAYIRDALHVFKCWTARLAPGGLFYGNTKRGYNAGVVENTQIFCIIVVANYDRQNEKVSI